MVEVGRHCVKWVFFKNASLRSLHIYVALYIQNTTVVKSNKWILINQFIWYDNNNPNTPLLWGSCSTSTADCFRAQPILKAHYYTLQLPLSATMWQYVWMAFTFTNCIIHIICLMKFVSLKVMLPIPWKHPSRSYAADESDGCCKWKSQLVWSKTNPTTNNCL